MPRIALAILLTASLITACQPRQCKCPELVTTATSIDWLGDGQAANDVSDEYRDGSDQPLQVRVSLPTEARSIDILGTLAARLDQAHIATSKPLPPELAYGDRITVESGTWTMTATAFSGEIEIALWSVDDDEAVAENIASLIDALGTLPTAGPNLRAITSEIDWLGTGEHPDSLTTGTVSPADDWLGHQTLGTPWPNTVQYQYRVEDPVATLEAIDERLRTAFPGAVVSHTDYLVLTWYATENWKLSFAGSVPLEEFNVTLRLVAPDAAAAEVLAPLVDAFDTLS